MNNRNKTETSEEIFLKNRAKRVNSASKKESTKKVSNKKTSLKKGTPNKSDKKSTAIKIAFTILCILVAICLVIAGMWIYFATKKPDAHINNEGGLIGAESFETGNGTKASLAENVYTFLALGTDKSGSLTDVIMVANYDINSQTVSLLQIPRDTYVKTSSKLSYDEKGNLTKDNYTGGYGGKINSAYSHARSLSTTYIDKLIADAEKLSDEQIKKLVKSEKYAFLGADAQKVSSYIKSSNNGEKQKIYANITRDFGIKYLSSLIYYNFGIPVDYYAQVNLNGFRGIVNALGGVEMYVPDDMYYKDPYQDLYINIKKGQQVLDGETAEGFVRFRAGYARADLARLDAQKLFMSAFLKKLFSPSSLPKIGNIITEIQKNLYTNLPLDDTLYFGNKAIGIDLTNGITMTTLPGSDAYINGGSYYSANKKAVMELVNQSFNKYDTALPEDRFMLYEVSSTPVSVTTSSIGDIENTVPDLGIITGGNQNQEVVDTTSDIETETNTETNNSDANTDNDTEHEYGETSNPEMTDDSVSFEETGITSDNTENIDNNEVNSEDDSDNESTVTDNNADSSNSENSEPAEDNSVQDEDNGLSHEGTIENVGETVTDTGSSDSVTAEETDSSETEQNSSENPVPAEDVDTQVSEEQNQSDNSHLLDSFVH